MKRTALSSLVAMVVLAPGLSANAPTCLNRNPCKPPPCEFFFELNMAKAMVRAGTGFLGDVEATDEQELRRFNRRVRDDMQKAYAKYATCPANYFYRRPPSFTTTSSAGEKCQIQGTLEDALATSNACAETIQAEYASARQEQLTCWAYANETTPMTFDEFRFTNRMSDQARVDSLQASLLAYLSSCAPDATTSRRIADSGLGALKKAGAKARRAWRAKRASAARGR